MTTHVLKGSKQQIAHDLAQLTGEVREAIVFVEDNLPTERAESGHDDDIFAEMRPFMVNVQDVVDSRESVYTRMDGE
jgi:hypothetical protein